MNFDGIIGYIYLLKYIEIIHSSLCNVHNWGSALIWLSLTGLDSVLTG